MSNYGIRNQPNPDRILEVEHLGRKYARFPVRTPMVNIGDSYINLIEKYVRPDVQDGDFIVCSEKVISICQKRVVHESEVEPSWLANLICTYVTKYPDDVGYENPRKMQVAINQSGYLRMIAAVVIGGIMKYIFLQRGWFYRIAGNRIDEIDGFNPIAVPPFNEYAILGPAEPEKTAQSIEDKQSIPAVIVDASNVATKILGKSKSIDHADTDLQSILLGNPMGQGKEQTPVIIVRKVH